MVDRLILTRPNGNVTSQSSAGNSRFTSEDWVQKTDGLTIDSPIIVDPRLVEDRDEDMNMDSEELVPPIHHPQRPALPPIQIMHASSIRHHHHQGTPISTASSTPTPLGPLVTVLPPTPLISTSPAFSIDASPMQMQTPVHPMTPVENSADDNAMVLSSPGGLVTAPAPRKQRFTMGPRADCIKCQMNVKGHSVHY
ncbi:hypothetical protein C0992_001666 [Termitomyces sp. T32_za158]|nr:hypothetical protein C0992_001666 [Termitomyces sp. T32_za158]